jgi:hypothetical protein
MSVTMKEKTMLIEAYQLAMKQMIVILAMYMVEREGQRKTDAAQRNTLHAKSKHQLNTLQ